MDKHPDCTKPLAGGVPPELAYVPRYDLHFDDVEIQVCVELYKSYEDEHPRPVETLGPVSEETERGAETAVANGEGARWFYSVYWHLPQGGVECVGDFENRADAERLYCSMKATICISNGEMEAAKTYAQCALWRTPT